MHINQGALVGGERVQAGATFRLQGGIAQMPASAAGGAFTLRPRDFR